MSKKKKTIPLRSLTKELGKGVVLMQVTSGTLMTHEDIRQAHRDNYHVFFLLEEGTASLEIDFRKHRLKAPSLMYIQPYQVHKGLAIDNVTFTALLINNENLHPEYVNILEDISPAKPLMLSKETYSILSETVSLSLKFYQRENEKLYHLLLKDSCNAFVALIASQYLIQSQSPDTLSRFDVISKAFKSLLERNFISLKRPSDYAARLKVSVFYLNECVKNVSGYPVSYHIQQRIVLEAKRLLCHTNKSVKEVAMELGYEDYAYFSRLFSKVTGMSALTFRSKNHD
ncbi:MAG: helix-turn-helix transcriptional regulator [Ferruginibacter sp.]